MEIGNTMAELLVTALVGSGTPWWVSAPLALAALLLYSPVVRDWVRRRRDRSDDD